MTTAMDHDTAKDVHELAQHLREQGHHDAADRLDQRLSVREVESDLLFVLREACETFLTVIEAIDPVSQTMIEKLRLTVESRLRLSDEKPASSG